MVFRGSARLGTMLVACAWAFFAPSARVAEAQSCHAPVLHEAPEEASLRVALAATLAEYDNRHGKGDYQGLALTLSTRWAELYAEVALPAYRIVRDGVRDTGLGDFAFGARYALIAPSREPSSSDSSRAQIRVGPELFATLPTGSADEGLGMGHVMLMPGVFASLELPSLFLLAQLSYGFAVAADHGAHSHSHSSASPSPSDDAVGGPIVDPMNARELGHAIGASYALITPLRVTARWFGAIDASGEGETRQVLGFGASVNLGLFDASAELQAPLVGSPFTYRAIASAGFQW